MLFEARLDDCLLSDSVGEPAASTYLVSSDDGAQGLYPEGACFISWLECRQH
jgi:hypothetical protein